MLFVFSCWLAMCGDTLQRGGLFISPVHTGSDTFPCICTGFAWQDAKDESLSLGSLGKALRREIIIGRKASSSLLVSVC
ncbi:hypothetical protein ASPTUDRAFT_37557 [Aspergillus tubingensis CBS 134.48]|uniref:Secreted protein n=1 Tax=Aspergillus tubingensis (strain CBS 134.48) TaxID=767770 RepID=A0A1L9NN93_ASPTC|nr:hypothetical protein ASPTUDRAFT_37557 [Aspergillus tubingensis CBS 134.48]